MDFFHREFRRWGVPVETGDMQDYHGLPRPTGKSRRLFEQVARMSAAIRLRLLKGRISRLFGASPFAQQVMILSRVVAFQAIEGVIRRLDGGDANLLFDYGDVLRSLFQTAQRFRGHWLHLGQRDRDLR